MRQNSGMPGKRDCANRLYVQSGIYEEFVSKLKGKAELKVGNGLDESVDIGPLINQKGYDKVVRHVKMLSKKEQKLSLEEKDINKVSRMPLSTNQGCF